MILLFYHLDYFRRNTSNDGIGRDIFRHHGSCGNDGIFSDGDTLQDSDVRTKLTISDAKVLLFYELCKRNRSKMTEK